MATLLNADMQPLNEMSSLTLAFIGDCVYELFVREHIISLGNCPVRKLNSKKVEWVRCDAQAKALSKLWDILSEEERDIASRGRNAHVGHVPKNADIADYHSATALETLFGYLYLKGDTERLHTLFTRILEN